MKPLRLDFIRPPQRRLAWLLLVAGIVSAAAVALHGQSLTEKLRAAEQRISRLERKAHEPLAARRREREPDAAAEIARQRAVPWQRLFSVVESAGAEDVALLVLQPDPRGEVRLEAEARDWQAMLDYLQRLSQSGFLARVHLVQHEIRSEQGAQPVRFAVLARWQAGPAAGDTK